MPVRRTRYRPLMLAIRAAAQDHQSWYRKLLGMSNACAMPLFVAALPERTDAGQPQTSGSPIKATG